jgi:hypothetical protein
MKTKQESDYRDDEWQKPFEGFEEVELIVKLEIDRDESV